MTNARRRAQRAAPGPVVGAAVVFALALATRASAAEPGPVAAVGAQAAQTEPAVAAPASPEASPAPTPPPPPTPPPGPNARPLAAAPTGPEGNGEEEVAASSLTDGAGGGNPAIDIYGFADFTFWAPLMKDSNQWLQVFDPKPTFAVGNLNLYMASALGEHWRSLAEVRFLYLPNGQSTASAADGTVTFTDTTVIDNAEFGRELRWGGIAIERAWIEYAAHELLTVRAGQILTPYGIWNVDHGSPTIIGIRRPYIVREALFPEHQTGFELYGAYAAGATKVGYHLTLSNGRGPVDSYRDYDMNKAVGGRLFAQTTALGDLAVGGSFYKGRYTDVTAKWTLAPDGSGKLDREIGTQYDELALAADLRWLIRNLLVQGEVILNDRAYVGEHRPAAPGNSGALLPDVRRWGSYALVGYRTHLWSLMPYVVGEYYRLGVGALPAQVGKLPEAQAFFVGVNARPTPAVVLKLEWQRIHFPDATGWGTDDITGLQAQAAWVF